MFRSFCKTLNIVSQTVRRSKEYLQRNKNLLVEPRTGHLPNSSHFEGNVCLNSVADEKFHTTTPTELVSCSCNSTVIRIPIPAQMLQDLRFSFAIRSSELLLESEYLKNRFQLHILHSISWLQSQQPTQFERNRHKPQRCNAIPCWQCIVQPYKSKLHD